MKGRSRVGWGIVALLFWATTINYIDRQVIGLLKPVIAKGLHWSETDYGYIIGVFQIAYAAGLLVSGWLLDKLGTRLGYTIAILVWSTGAFLHAFARTVLGFAMVRAVLGFGEAANFPAAIKTVSEWFPKRDRALATGIFNSGSNIGAILAPGIVVVIALHFGWQWAFILTALLGFIWIVFWLLFYNEPARHKRVGQAELSYIMSDVDPLPSVRAGWGTLFTFRQTYVLCLVRLLTDWVWWFFLFWAPDFLSKTQHIDLKVTVFPLILIYTTAGVGGISGGALSSWLIKSGRSVDFSRKAVLLMCALSVLPLIFAARSSHLWIVVGIVGLAVAAHQGWSANTFTLVSDMYPKHMVATMTGLAGFSGAVGGAVASPFIGAVLQLTGSYSLIFLMASVMYLLAWVLLKVFVRRIGPIG